MGKYKGRNSKLKVVSGAPTNCPTGRKGFMSGIKLPDDANYEDTVSAEKRAYSEMKQTRNKGNGTRRHWKVFFYFIFSIICVKKYFIDTPDSSKDLTKILFSVNPGNEFVSIKYIPFLETIKSETE